MASPAWRSGFERKLRERLDAEGVEYAYEEETFDIMVPHGKVTCPNCGVIDGEKKSRYTPDFFFTDWIIEAKGKFTAKDRKRFLALIKYHGDNFQFGLVFMRDNKISKASQTRYTDWCAQNDIPCAVGWFKQEWLA